MNNAIPRTLMIIALIAISPMAGLSQANTGPEVDKKQIEESVDTSGDREIVVTATRTEIRKSEIGSSLTVITEEDIAKKGQTTVVDALRQVPGLNITQDSVFGGKTNIYIRGGKSDNVLVMIDGVEVNDPMNPNRSFDFAHLTTDNIERIEVVRGPQSTLYGSDAIGGVINIITKKGKGVPKMNLSSMGGSYYTFRETFSLSGAADRAYYSLALARIDSRGISKAASPPGSGEKGERDGYENTTLSSRLGISPFGNSWINFSMHFTGAAAAIDEDAFIDDPDRKTYSRSLSAKIEFFQPVAKWWNQSLSASYADSLRRDNDRPDSHDQPGVTYATDSWFEGEIRKAAWQHSFPIGEIDEITAGIEAKQEKGAALANTDFGFGPSLSELDEKSVLTLGYYLQNHLRLWKRFFATAGIRTDRHEYFGSTTNYRLSASCLVPVTGTWIRANYGTGFKAPSLYQIYDPYSGNKNLRPEKSRSGDLGLEQPFWKERITLGITWFHNIYTNMISFNPAPPYQSINLGRVETKGIETEMTLTPVKPLNITATYTYTRTGDMEKDEELLRRPRHQGSLNINWAFLEKGNLNCAAVYTGKRRDYWYDYASFTPRYVTGKSYVRVDVFASYGIMGGFEVFGKIENLTDRNYMEIYGFATPRRSYYAGVKGVL